MIKKRKYTVFLVDEKEGRIYCNDGKWRLGVIFGNVSGCCKFWKKPAYADKVAQKAGLLHYTVKYVYPGDEVTCFGQVISGN